MNNCPIIDCHCHIYPEKIAEKAVAGIGKFYDLDMHCDGRLNSLLEQSKSYGITHNLIFSVATTPKQVQSINSFIAESVAQNKEQFTGLGALHPDSQDIEGDIEHLVELGLKGVKLHPDVQGVAIDDKRCIKIYELCQGRLPVLMHTGDKRYNLSNPANLLPILNDFPNLKVIGAHFGGYSIWDDAMANYKGYKNLYVDTSSSLAFIPIEKAKALVEFYGVERVLFATDFPMWKANGEIETVEKLGLSEEDKRKIYFENACELFGIDRLKIENKFKKDKKALGV